MNDEDWQDETILSGGAEWRKEENNTYTKYMTISYKNGRSDIHLMESGVTEKEFFRRRLDGSA